MKKVLPVILLLCVLAAAVGFGFYYHIQTQTKFNDGYVNGNNAGNLYNAGLFCASDGTVFFANPSDEYRLYAMDSDGSNLRKISNDIASFINADDNYIYYVRNNTSIDTAFSFLSINTDSLCRINRDGTGDTVILDPDPCMYASLIGNEVYYLHYDTDDNTTLYKVKIDGTGRQQVDKNAYFTSCTDGQYFYYNGLSGDHNIWRFDTATLSSDLIYSGNCWMPTVIGDSLFFMDCDDNYKLARVSLSTGEKITLSDDRIDCYNICGGYIYFQRNDTDNPAFCRMNTDGSGYTEIASGNYTDINATATDVYFREFHSGQMYRTPITDTGTMELFLPET